MQYNYIFKRVFRDSKGRVYDVNCRLLEIKNVQADSIIRIGDGYRPGAYYIKVQQGKEHKELKLIKFLK